MHERTVRARTATGIVEGFTRDGVHRWRSIPYARAPVGSLRFRAPQPAQPWPGVRHCHTFANCAPQQRRYTVMGIGRYQTRSEDCLTLNVVTPEEPATQPLPVMVFIHGGGYILGSSATPIYDGAALARRGCVYVSVNYRLGALGCLDLSSLSTPQITLDSNVYLRDLVLALRWVHDNIAEFGGDPGNVTIFGESAGAHITATLLAVPAAKGLFARAISESPAAGMVRSREVAAEFAARFANLIGARTQDAANALMQASPAQLVEAQHHLIRQGMRKRLGARRPGRHRRGVAAHPFASTRLDRPRAGVDRPGGRTDRLRHSAGRGRIAAEDVCPTARHRRHRRIRSSTHHPPDSAAVLRRGPGGARYR